MTVKGSRVFDITAMLLWIALHVYMLLQIGLGILWMALNLGKEMGFGDTVEYLNLSDTLRVDEYRTIMYPLLLRATRIVDSGTGISYLCMVQVLQTIICGVSIFYCIWLVGKRTGITVSLRNHVFITLYIICIPMIMFMNYSVLTDSLAFSFLVVTVAEYAMLWHTDRLEKRDVWVFAATLFMESLMRADRIFSVSIFMVIYGAVQFVISVPKGKEAFINIKSNTWKIVVISFVTIGMAGGINHATQTPGLYGRIRTDLGFILVDSFAWTRISANYERYPEEIKDILTYDEAVAADADNNSMMYSFAPNIESKVGEDKADQYYKEITSVVMKNNGMDVIAKKIENCLWMCITPCMNYWSYVKGRLPTAIGWNVYCCEQSSVELTHFIVRVYDWVAGVFLLPLSLFLRIIFRKMEEVHSLEKGLLPFFVMHLIVILWFVLGDGAAPNDRYILLGYAFWALYEIGMIDILVGQHSYFGSVLKE